MCVPSNIVPSYAVIGRHVWKRAGMQGLRIGSQLAFHHITDVTDVTDVTDFTDVTGFTVTIPLMRQTATPPSLVSSRLCQTL